jgi:hypothetical protein
MSGFKKLRSNSKHKLSKMTTKKYLLVMWSLLLGSITYSQNVGIGTTLPLDKLTVQTPTGVYGITHTDGIVRLSTYIGGSNAAWLGTATTHPLHFFAAGSSPVMTITTNGNVGVGILNPAYKLEISNRMRIRSQGTNGVTAGIWFNNYNNTAEEGFIGEVGPGAPNHIGMYGTVSGWQLVMNTVSGNVGINTFTTGAGNGKLNIASTGNAIKLHGGGQYISFYDAGNNYKGYMWNPGNNIEIGTDPGNTLGEVNLKVKGIHALTVQSDARVRVGDIGCTIPVYTMGNINAYPKFSSLGQIGIKKDHGDRLGEWTMSYSGPFSGDGLAFHFNGGLKTWLSETDGAWETPSDIRLKEDLEEYKPVLDGIKNIHVLTYRYKSAKPGVRSFGLIAQNVHQYFPEIVSSGGKDGLMGIDYAKTGILAIKAIQEQQQIIESQQKKIEELEKRLELLEKSKY